MKSKVVPTPEQPFWSDFQLASMEYGVSYKAWGNVNGAGSHYSHAFPTKKEEYKQKLLKHLEKCVVWEDGVPPSLYSEGITKLPLVCRFFLCNVTGNQRCSKPKIRGVFGGKGMVKKDPFVGRKCQVDQGKAPF